MLRKSIIVLFTVVVVFVLTGVSMASDTTTFNFQLEVEPYIEVLTCTQNMLGTPKVSGPSFYGNIMYYTGSEGSWPGGIGDFAYANVPFQVTFTGDNPAGDGVPTFAREERDGNGAGLNRFDRLVTTWGIRVHHNAGYVSGIGGPAENFPATYTANEAPHNGWVGIDFMAPGPIVDGPAAAIDRAQEYGDSPDAGIYRASITAVISVHPDYEPI